MTHSVPSAVVFFAVTSPWLLAPPAVSGQTNPPDSIPICNELAVPPSESRSLTVMVPQDSERAEPYLFFRAVANSDRTGGYCNRAMRVSVNGQPVDGARLCNRGQKATMQNGHVLSVAQGDGCFLIPWAPDFESTDKHEIYALTDGVRACEYELYLGGLVQPGENAVTFANNNTAGLDYTVRIGDVEYRRREEKPTSDLLRPAPTGDLPVCEPRVQFPRTYDKVDVQGTAISVRAGERHYQILSEFSTPDARWVTKSNANFDFFRRIVEHDEWIEVQDTFTNRTNENLPIMQRHRALVSKEATGVWLAGAKMPTKRGRHISGANPSAYAADARGGVGLVALNDELRVHATLIADADSIQLTDPHFVLAPQAAYSAHWAIVPVRDPDYFAFVNAARRMLGANFRLDVAFAFMFHKPPVYEWSDEQFTTFVDNKNANFVVKSNYGVRTKHGHPARCTDWIAGPHDVYRDFHQRVRRLYPDKSVKTGIYYHCFLDTNDANKQRFSDDRALGADGTQIVYGQGRHSYMSLFIPTLKADGWGRESARVLDVILDDIGVDGVFWDEFSWSTTQFVYNHLDGCSADIDPKTHRIRRLKGSVALLSRDFRVYQVKRIQERGSPFIVNGAPWTRSLADLKFPAFTETGSISHCRKMQLYSPIALGDHLSERSERDAYRVMLNALDYGCLYAWYGSNFSVPHATLTEHMYPITPLEIHAGYVIGKERIITNRSGLFGWNDASGHRAYVYDRDGRASEDVPVRSVHRDGKQYAEVRIPGGYSAAIVRESPRRTP